MSKPDFNVMETLVNEVRFFRERMGYINTLIKAMDIVKEQADIDGALSYSLRLMTTDTLNNFKDAYDHGVKFGINVLTPEIQPLLKKLLEIRKDLGFYHDPVFKELVIQAHLDKYSGWQA